MDLTEQEKTEVLANAPRTIVLDGHTWLIERHTTASVFAVYEWAVERARAWNPFREVLDALAGLPVTPEQTQALLVQAARIKAAGEVPADQVTRCLRTREGVAFQFWILARGECPSLTYERALSMITDENRIDAYVKLDEASGANQLNKAMISAGFFPPASAGERAGS
jgi:hypothetical protein